VNRPGKDIDHCYLCTFTDKDEVLVWAAEKFDPGDSSRLFVSKFP
jgi:hypothetical protein